MTREKAIEILGLLDEMFTFLQAELHDETPLDMIQESLETDLSCLQSLINPSTESL